MVVLAAYIVVSGADVELWFEKMLGGAIRANSYPLASQTLPFPVTKATRKSTAASISAAPLINPPLQRTKSSDPDRNQDAGYPSMKHQSKSASYPSYDSIRLRSLAEQLRSDCDSITHLGSNLRGRSSALTAVQ